MANHLQLAIEDLDKRIADLLETRKGLRRALDLGVGTSRSGRRMSEEGRAKIREAQRKRWAKARKSKTAKKSPTTAA